MSLVDRVRTQQRVLLEVSEAETDTASEAPKRGRPRRSNRLASIPDAYDPTPTYHQIESGLRRPQIRCFARSVAPLSIDDLLGGKAVGDDAGRIRRFLSQKCASIRGNFWVKQRQDGRWIVRARA